MQNYKPSGKFSPLSFIYFIVTTIIALPILGLIYAYLLWYIPIVYINFLITIGYACSVGFIINIFAISFGKVRNPFLGAFFGFLGAFFALYFHYAVWVDLVINSGEVIGNSRLGITISNIKFLDVFALATQPQLLLDYILEINKIGTWGIRSATVSGTFLYVIWAIEALVVFVISVVVNYSGTKDPFCELENAWYKSQKLPKFNYIDDKITLLKAISNSDSKAFFELEKVENEDSDHSIFDLYSAPKNNDHYLTITNKLAKINKKGNLDFESEEVTQFLRINGVIRNLLLEK